jgi:hypothetical protein
MSITYPPAWQGRIDNLCWRFPSVGHDAVVVALHAHGGNMWNARGDLQSAAARADNFDVACQNGELQTVRDSLAQGADPNAAQGGQLAVCELLTSEDVGEEIVWSMDAHGFFQEQATEAEPVDDQMPQMAARRPASSSRFSQLPARRASVAQDGVGQVRG